jgi:hypothetical protein
MVFDKSVLSLSKTAGQRLLRCGHEGMKPLLNRDLSLMAVCSGDGNRAFVANAGDANGPIVEICP